MAKKHSNSKQDEEARLALEDFEKSAAPLTRDQMEMVELRFTAQDTGILRRFALGALARSGAELTEGLHGADFETAAEMMRLSGELPSYADRLSEFAEMMRSAALRVGLASVRRPDYDALRECVRRAERQEGLHG